MKLLAFQIGVNRVWEACLDRSEFSLIFGIFFFDLSMILGFPWVSQGTPKILVPISFRNILALLEPLQGPDGCLKVIFVDFEYFFLAILD